MEYMEIVKSCFVKAAFYPPLLNFRQQFKPFKNILLEELRSETPLNN